MKSKPDTRQQLLDVADIIERFLAGGGAPYEWDDFVSLRDRNPVVEGFRKRACDVCVVFPAKEQWCSDAGLAELANIAGDVRRAANAV